MYKKSFTLIELVVVMVIIGITATIGIAYLNAIKERGIDREVRASLKQMSSAERIYDLKNGNYFPSTGADAQARIQSINSALKLYLPEGGSRNWDYTTYIDGCVQGQRSGDDNRYWRKCISEDDPVGIVLPARPAGTRCPGDTGILCP